MSDWSLPEWIAGIGGLLGGAAAIYVAFRRRAIEKYVAELNRVSYEHEVVFSRLHERRVEVIAELYTKLVEAEVAFGSWVRPLQLAGESPIDEKAKTAMQAGNEFQDLFLRSRIWLDEDLCTRLDALNKAIYEVFVNFTDLQIRRSGDDEGAPGGVETVLGQDERGRRRDQTGDRVQVPRHAWCQARELTLGGDAPEGSLPRPDPGSLVRVSDESPGPTYAPTATR
jgi:hypothetical protein